GRDRAALARAVDDDRWRSRADVFASRVPLDQPAERVLRPAGPWIAQGVSESRTAPSGVVRLPAHGARRDRVPDRGHVGSPGGVVRAARKALGHPGRGGAGIASGRTLRGTRAVQGCDERADRNDFPGAPAMKLRGIAAALLVIVLAPAGAHA